MLESLLRKVMAKHPGTNWGDWLKDCLFAMRVLVSRGTGMTPYRLVCKQEPVFPDWLEYYECPAVRGAPLPLDINQLTEQEMLEELERIWDDTMPAVRIKLAQGDERMIREYKERHRLQEFEVPHYFKYGDQVLLKQRRPGKMRVKAPVVTFVRYKGNLGLTAEVRTG